MTGLNVRHNPVLSVLAVGGDAVVWLDRGASKAPQAEIYAVRHGSRAAIRIGTGWDLAPAADGRGVWVKRYKDRRHCSLAEIGLDGRPRRSARRVPCSTRLAVAGSVPLLVRRGSVSDPLTERKLPPLGGVGWAIAGDTALSSGGTQGPLALTDLRTGEQRPLPWPSKIGGPGSEGGTDQAVVRASDGLVALSFSDPTYQDSGTQVTDLWLLHPKSGSVEHLPGMPATVSLKFTSMAWASDGRLVLLARSGGRDIVAAWRPGESRIGLRRVRLPIRNSGSDTFVLW